MTIILRGAGLILAALALYALIALELDAAIHEQAARAARYDAAMEGR